MTGRDNTAALQAAINEAAASGGGLVAPAHDFGPGRVGKPTPFAGHTEVQAAADENYLVYRETIDSGDLRELTLWRVASFSKEWVDNEPGAPEPSGTTTSTKRVLKEVEKLLAGKPWMITIQQQP